MISYWFNSGNLLKCYIYLYKYSYNYLVESNMTSWIEKSSSSKSYSLGFSGIANYSFDNFLFFIIFIRNPVILVSSQAITSASNNALSYLGVQSYKFPIGVGHMVKVPLEREGLPMSTISSLNDKWCLQF